MRTYREIIERLEDYEGAYLIHNDIGLIAWQVSTGENVELLFIEVAEQRKGYGTELVKRMCEKINPYNSVFVFTRSANEQAVAFYKSLGFDGTYIDGLYKEGAILFVANYEKLCQTLTTKS